MVLVAAPGKAHPEFSWKVLLQEQVEGVLVDSSTTEVVEISDSDHGKSTYKKAKKKPFEKKAKKITKQEKARKPGRKGRQVEEDEYDLEDAFIDDKEAWDEEGEDTELGGFYIRSRKLRRTSSSIASSSTSTRRQRTSSTCTRNLGSRTD